MAEAPGKPASCPICGEPANPDYKPFCSKRCADIDLHRWLNGVYVIAGESGEEEDQEPLFERPAPHDEH